MDPAMGKSPTNERGRFEYRNFRPWEGFAAHANDAGIPGWRKPRGLWYSAAKTM
jgi:hypothetical protein